MSNASPLFQHILFPVDFSAQCADAVKSVACWAKRNQAKVSLLHCVEFGHRNYINWYAYLALVDLESIRTDSRRRLDEMKSACFGGLEVKAELAEGDPAHAIVDYAKAHNADLIMMPTTGQGRLKRLLIGSVAAKVLYDAPCPVWTDAHPHALEAASAPAGPPKGPILCAVDGTEDSVPLIQFARRIAEQQGAELRLIHVLPTIWLDPEALPGPMLRMEGVLEQDAGGRLERIQAKAGTKLPADIVFGELPKALQRKASETGARLLMIGRGHMHATLGRLRTHVNAIIERAPCPVLSF